MNYELLVAGGGVLAALLLGLLYARASAKAVLVDRVADLNKGLTGMLAAQRALTTVKEEYIRELEKTVLGSLPASELALRLNRLFAANRGGAPGTVLPRDPKARSSGT